MLLLPLPLLGRVVVPLVPRMKAEEGGAAVIHALSSFFAGTELKLCLAHILLKYDIRLKEGYYPQPMVLGVYAIVDPMTQLEVRRREHTEDLVF